MRAYGMPMDELEDGLRRVLLVGRNLPRDIVQALSSLDRYEVRTASSGFEAGVAVQQFHPTMIVLDVNGDSEAVATICRNIKANASFSGVRIIAVSENNQDKSQDWYDSYGFDAFLTGAFTLEELVTAIDGTKKLVGT